MHDGARAGHVSRSAATHGTPRALEASSAGPVRAPSPPPPPPPRRSLLEEEDVRQPPRRRLTAAGRSAEVLTNRLLCFTFVSRSTGAVPLTGPPHHCCWHGRDHCCWAGRGGRASRCIVCSLAGVYVLAMPPPPPPLPPPSPRPCLQPFSLPCSLSPSPPSLPPPLAGIVTVIGLHLSVAIILQFCSSVSPAPASLTRL